MFIFRRTQKWIEFQNVSERFRTFQNVSERFRTLPSVSERFRTIHFHVHKIHFSMHAKRHELNFAIHQKPCAFHTTIALMSVCTKDFKSIESDQWPEPTRRERAILRSPATTPETTTPETKCSQNVSERFRTFAFRMHAIVAGRGYLDCVHWMDRHSKRRGEKTLPGAGVLKF